MTLSPRMLEDDYANVIERVGDWTTLNGARLAITGGTGFIGRWMLEALHRADARHSLGVEVVALSRNPEAFAIKAPALAAWRGLSFVRGDVTAPLALDGRFDVVVHAATDASADLNLNRPLAMFDTVVSGTRHALDLACRSGAKRFLLLSSGAVYGAQPANVPLLDEGWRGAPDPLVPSNAYGEGKRAAEMLCAIYARQFGLEFTIARIFALLGPMLPLDMHFAVGNFIRDAMAKRPIIVQSAGTAVRSYLYIADLVAWLWKMVLAAPSGAAYNLGSEEAVSIAELAHRVAAVLGNTGAEIRGSPDGGWNPGRYVPSISLIRDQLAVEQTIGLDEAIRRTAHWNGWTS